MKRVTIHDVAKTAGVSYQTVSRVLNHRPDVSDETRLRVLQTIQELGFQPNSVARSLATQRTNMLGLITIDFEDHFFAGVCSGIQAEAYQQGYMLMICSTAREEHLEAEYVHRLRERQVEGIIIIRDTLIRPEMENQGNLRWPELPYVVTSMKHPGEKCPCVDIDNVDGARQAVECLLQYGHRKIAMITSPKSYQVSFDRTQGYMDAFARFNVVPDPELFIEGDWHFSGGYRAMNALLARGREFSAVFAHNDHMAIGAFRALNEAGLHIPGDVSIVGFDDLPVSEHLDPPLTTVWQPRHAMGAEAVRLLVDSLGKEPVEEGRRVFLKPRLVQRRSVRNFNP